MKRINSSYKLVEFLSGRRSGADTVVNVATIKFRFRAIVLIEKFVLDVAYEKIGVAVFSQPPLISFKRDKNIGNFLVRSAFQTSNQPGTFKCARARCKTCPFICNVEKFSGPKRSIRSLIILLVPQPMSSLYNLHSLQKVIHRRNRETTRRQIPRTPSRRRKKKKKRI